MNPNPYLTNIIKKYSITGEERVILHRKVRPVYRDIRKWAGEYLLKIIPSGSFLKGTSIRGNVDIDLLISLNHRTPNSLKEIYNGLFEYFNQSYYVTKQNVSIGLVFQGVKVDLVPAKRLRNVTYPHSIYVSTLDTWTKTNIHRHISVIKKSPHRKIILLLKIWRDLHGIDFPSFLLELTVLEALKNKRMSFLNKRFLTVLKYLLDEFRFAKIYDPANTNNVVSDTISDTEKNIIADTAFESYESKFWEKIVWGLYERKETA